jgi:GT2 family glycosyltransferase
MDIELSIVIVNLNTKDLTVGCIKSIEKEAGDLSFEVLLTDNGSNDGSVEAFKKIKEEKYWKNKFTLILNDINTGYAKANNQGIRKAKGKFILLLNNDTVVHKDALQNLLTFARKTPDAGVVGSKLLNIDGSLQMSCYHFPTITNAVKEYWLGQKGLFEKFAPKGDAPVTVDSVVGAAFLITPEAKKRVGILDERYFAYFEDIDYCRQTWKKGLKVYYLPSSVIAHYHGATFKKMADEEQRWKKLIPSSKIYYGFFKHHLIIAIMWLGQKKNLVLGKS